MITSPLLAHGQNVLEFYTAVVVIADILGVISVGLGLWRRTPGIARDGLVFGALALLVAFWLGGFLGWEFDASFISIGIALLFPISGLGIWLSLRRRNAEP